MTMKTKTPDPIHIEPMEARLFMSAVPQPAMSVGSISNQTPTISVAGQSGVAPDIATFQAGQRFTAITISPFTLFPDSTRSPKWIKVRLIHADTGKVELTRTYYPAKGQGVTLSNLVSDHVGTFNVVYSDSLGDHRDLPQVMVTAAPPHELWFSEQPRVLNTDAVIQVTVLDQYGNLTTADDGETLVLHSWLPKASLGSAPRLTGETSAIVGNGVADFTGLSMNDTGTARLIARLGDLKPTLSNVFRPASILTLPPGGDAIS